MDWKSTKYLIEKSRRKIEKTDETPILKNWEDGKSTGKIEKTAESSIFNSLKHVRSLVASTDYY